MGTPFSNRLKCNNMKFLVLLPVLTAAISAKSLYLDHATQAALGYPYAYAHGSTIGAPSFIARRPVIQAPALRTIPAVNTIPAPVAAVKTINAPVKKISAPVVASVKTVTAD